MFLQYDTAHDICLWTCPSYGFEASEKRFSNPCPGWSIRISGFEMCIDQFHEYANGVWSAYITNTILIFIVRSIISHYALIQGYCFG